MDNLPIKTMDFGRVVSNRKLKGSGLVAGDLVMVYSLSAVQAKKADPYLQRIYVTVLKVNDDGSLPGTIGQERQGILMDPRSLEKVDEETQKQLYTTFTHQVQQSTGDRRQQADNETTD